ncbi:hypothetical protein LEP1GSC165_2823 [Leptospira santarosai str. CBC523]|nr:hypothetical protein LEP1GSC165_2823 [Leptospira santarosai str. CBC523]
MRILFLKRIRYNKCESDCYVAIVGATPKFLIRPNSKPSNSRFLKKKRIRFKKPNLTTYKGACT